MRRLFAGLLAFVALTATLLVLPVYAAPLPEAEPVTTSSDLVDMGSVHEPAPEADVQSGTSDPVAGVAATAPTLTVSRTHVDPFSLVGVTWAYDAGVTDTVVQVRVQDAKGRWGDWTEVTPETADQGTTTRTGAELRGGTSPLWTGPSTGVDVELVTRSGDQPTDVQLDLVDPGTSAADDSIGAPAVTDTAHAATTMPPVYSRAQWGADESIRTWDPEYAPTIKAATVHHTADTNNYTADDVPAMMRSIYRYHTVSLGWGDIGYNVIVDKFGRLWEGRYGGLASTVIGAHAGGFNTSTFGVSMLGNYDIAPTTQPMIDAVSAIIAWKFSLYGVDPRGSTTLTSSGGGTSKYAAGVKVTLPTIFGHRDVGATACPGVYGYARLGEIRDAVTSRMSSSTIDGRYNSDPALRSALGAKVGTEQSAGGVSWQVYTGGRLYSSAVGGTRLVRGAILDTYLAAGGPAALGPPTSDDAAAPGGGGYFVDFTGGSVYWSAGTGAQVVRGAILASWLAAGGSGGYLGYPTTSDAATPEGRGYFTRFQGGDVYWSAATGAQIVRGAILASWLAAGGSGGYLGFPAGSDAGVGDGRGFFTRFQGGDLYWTAATGIQLVRGSILTTWLADGGATGFLGYPVAGDHPVADGRGAAVDFEGGSIYWSPASGTQLVRGSIRDTWLAGGGAGGPLGFPVTSDAATAEGRGAFVRFQGGDVYWSPATGTQVVRGAILSTWLAAGGSAGFLGFPTSSDAATAEGRGFFVDFSGGSLYWSPGAGTQLVRGSILTTWLGTGGSGGPLGFPVTSDAATRDGRGAFVRFEGGDVYWSPATGTQVVRGAILSSWLASGGSAGFLGFPTSSDAPTPEGRGYVVHFQGGDLYWSAPTGTQLVRGSILSTWLAAGGSAGPLGFPVTSDAPTADGRGFVVRFQGGDVYYSAATGTRIVRGALAAAYTARGGSASSLGFPTADTYAVPGGQRSDFQHGSLTLDTATGRVS